MTRTGLAVNDAAVNDAAVNDAAVTDAAVIDRFEVGWLVDPAEIDPAQVDGRRLDGLIAALLDGPLEDALRNLGLPASAEVCIRRLEVPVQRLWLGGPDGDFVDQWGRAIRDAVADALESARAGGGRRPGDGVVAYRSLAHALSDLVRGAALGDLDRVWAWRQLGLWPDGIESGPGRAVEVAAAALLHQPSLIPGAFADAAAGGHLTLLVECLGDHLPSLAEAAWSALGGSAVGPSPHRPEPPPAPAPPLALAIARSRFGRAAEPIAGRAAPELRAALAALAVAVAEPAAVARPDSPALVDAVALLMGTARPTAPPVDTPDGTARPSQPASGGDDQAPVAGDGAGVTADPSAVDAGPGSDPDPYEPSPEPVPAGAATEAAGDDPRPGSADEPPSTPARNLRTGWGGLLFLLHVVADVGWPESDDLIRDLGLRAVLHRVGLDLLGRAAPDVGPPGADDPAVLAFCGLLPGDDPPAEAPADAGGVADIARLADRLLQGLRARLDGTPLALAAEPALLLAVCRRRAEVVADPGWIDILLELDKVSVDVRLAGLDLDPGYLPWLGCAVRFVYG